MASKIKMNEELKKKIIAAITEKKTPIKEVAKKLFMTDRQLRLLLTEWKVELPKNKRYEKKEAPAREELMTEYAKAGNTKKLAEHYQVGINTVNRWMIDYKIPARKLVMKDEDKVALLEGHLSQLKDLDL